MVRAALHHIYGIFSRVEFWQVNLELCGDRPHGLNVTPRVMVIRRK